MLNPTLKQPLYIALLLVIAVTVAILGGFIGSMQTSSVMVMDTIEMPLDQAQKDCMTTDGSSHSQQCSSMHGCFSGHQQCTGIPAYQSISLSEAATEFSLTEAIYSPPFSPISIRPPIV